MMVIAAIVPRMSFGVFMFSNSALYTDQPRMISVNRRFGQHGCLNVYRPGIKRPGVALL
jgi:hypothetical protein